ncbi:MAG: SMP-30/gluconolactonase/LRE family protein [Anaerolineaceae bacterium]|nr:SMP-30/gluconolactonase/LRE family protein [Anaerolineaceae bacterium]
MKTIEISTPIVSCKDTLGESPLWDHRRNALFWIDIENGLIHYYEPFNKDTETYLVDEKVGCIAMHESGGFILAAASGLSYWCPDSGCKKVFLPVKHSHKESMFNDGKVDPLGRFWIGSKGPKGSSKLWMVQENKLIEKISDLTISNGLDWSVDKGVFYHTDSGDNAIYRYDIDLQTTTLSNRQTFFRPKKGTPDGLTIDSDGNIWTAIWDGWQVLQLNPAGEVLSEISMPVQRPTSITFGGQDLRQLFITSASEGLTESERLEQPYAGDLFVIEPGVTGLNANLAADDKIN